MFFWPFAPLLLVHLLWRSALLCACLILGLRLPPALSELRQGWLSGELARGVAVLLALSLVSVWALYLIPRPRL